MIALRALACGVAVVFAATASAQDLYYYAPHAGPPVKVDSSKQVPAGPPQSIVKGGATTFNIIYMDVVNTTGNGFDDATEGAARRATAEAVVGYIGDVLNEPAPVTIEVVFDASQTDGGGALASGGTFFSTSSNGFSNGIAFTHLTTGSDPSLLNPDITSQVDFGFTWNSDHTEATQVGEFDLFSVLLHEITHGLGFVSLSDSSGDSVFTGSNPGRYSVWDQLMRFNTSDVIFDTDTTFLAATTVFTSNNLSFAGTNATLAFGSQPPVFAPATFSSSSLSHYRTGFVNSVMEHSISAGIDEREFSEVDIATFVDLGYVNAEAPVVLVVTQQSQGGGGYVEEGQALRLFVQFSGVTGAATANWLKDGLPFTAGPGQGVNFTQNGQSLLAELTIDAVTSGDAGRYSVSGSDEAKGAFQSSNLDVLVVSPGALPLVGAAGLGVLIGALMMAGIRRVVGSG